MTNSNQHETVQLQRGSDQRCIIGVMIIAATTLTYVSASHCPLFSRTCGECTVSVHFASVSYIIFRANLHSPRALYLQNVCGLTTWSPITILRPSFDRYKMSSTQGNGSSRAVLADGEPHERHAQPVIVPSTSKPRNPWPDMNTRPSRWTTHQPGWISQMPDRIGPTIEIGGDRSLGSCGSDARFEHAIPAAIKLLCPLMHGNLQSMIHVFYTKRRPPMLVHVADLHDGGITGAASAKSGCLKLYIDGNSCHHPATIV